jgi:hypothetical protein
MKRPKVDPNHNMRLDMNSSLVRRCDGYKTRQENHLEKNLDKYSHFSLKIHDEISSSDMLKEKWRDEREPHSHFEYHKDDIEQG